MIINENGIDVEVSGKDKDAVVQSQSEINAEFQKHEDAKKEAKDARAAILTRLGLTDEDFKALGL